jgi:hypothetical protein
LLKGIFPLYLSCVYILCLIRLISSTSLSITLLLYCSKLAVHCVMLFSYTDPKFQYFSLFQILFPSPKSP